MSMRDFISEVIGRVRDERKNLAEAVTAGTNVHTFDDYQKLIGQIEGLDLTLTIVNEILTENDDDL
jgi:hypothetical protein